MEDVVFNVDEFVTPGHFYVIDTGAYWKNPIRLSVRHQPDIDRWMVWRTSKPDGEFRLLSTPVFKQLTKEILAHPYGKIARVPHPAP